MTIMPAVFAGHGSPMNAIEDTPIRREWQALGKELPRPKTILSSRSSRATARTLAAAIAIAIAEGMSQSAALNASPRTMRENTTCCPSAGTSSCQRESFIPANSTTRGTKVTRVVR